jgi:outer membrane protein OmpA-like peptidoglycan-associated protein
MDVRVQIRAHTDIRGNDNYNLHLSQRRAQSVVNYLTQSGIDSNRLTAKGFGETEPVVSCAPLADCSSADHQMNRRAEITIESTIIRQEKRNVKSHLDEKIQLKTEE